MIRILPIFLFAWSPCLAFDSLQTSETVTIGGLKQWISVRTAKQGLPVMLFLHGGPGNSATGYADRFSKELQEHFTFVLWDQRETGKTLAMNRSDSALTLSRMESDAVELIRYLLHRYSQQKVYLMGHSWGGFLALLIAKDYPDLIQVCLTVSPMVNQLESERRSLEWLKDVERNNPAESAALATVEIPFRNGDQLYIHRSGLARHGGNKPPGQAYVVQWAKTWLHLFNEASGINLADRAPRLSCPVWFFVGGRDKQTLASLTREYYNALKADKKRLFWFEESGHNLLLQEPARFQELILKEIKGDQK